jgi:iron only hydrogenase large subunit-like protein
LNRPDEIYHVSVMPCYDKKLEASRQDFRDELYSTRDVDCVITTGELELMMREKGWDLSIPVQDELESLPHSAVGFEFPELMSHTGTSSGSYLHSLLDMLTLTSPDALDLSVRTVRSSDYEEYTLQKRDSGEVVFKGAKCYGFRNLQNVVRKVGRDAGVQVGKGVAGGLRARMKRRAGGKEGEEEKEKIYDYVEVMACPGGCVNGRC